MVSFHAELRTVSIKPSLQGVTHTLDEPRHELPPQRLETIVKQKQHQALSEPHSSLAHLFQIPIDEQMKSPPALEYPH